MSDVRKEATKPTGSRVQDVLVVVMLSATGIIILAIRLGPPIEPAALVDGMSFVFFVLLYAIVVSAAVTLACFLKLRGYGNMRIVCVLSLVGLGAGGVLWATHGAVDHMFEAFEEALLR